MPASAWRPNPIQINELRRAVTPRVRRAAAFLIAIGAACLLQRTVFVQGNSRPLVAKRRFVIEGWLHCRASAIPDINCASRERYRITISCVQRDDHAADRPEQRILAATEVPEPFLVELPYGSGGHQHVCCREPGGDFRVHTEYQRGTGEQLENEPEIHEETRIGIAGGREESKGTLALRDLAYGVRDEKQSANDAEHDIPVAEIEIEHRPSPC